MVTTQNQTRSSRSRPAAAVIKGAMAAIADGGMLPVAKDANHPDSKRVQTSGDKAKASTLAAEVMAASSRDGDTWVKFARRVIEFTSEGREAFLDIMAASIKDAKKEASNDDASKNATRLAGVSVASAYVMASQLRTIAKAWNDAATVDGLRQFAFDLKPTPTAKKNPVLPEFDTIRMGVIYAYARSILRSEAGRKPDTWLVKLNKFLERNKPAEDDKEGVAAYDDIVTAYNKAVSKDN